MTVPTGLTDHFYKTLVPKTPIGNRAWRVWLTETAPDDEELQADIFCACARDPLFYFNSFLWLLEPRDRATWQQDTKWGDTAKEIPFLTRHYQNDVIMRSARAFGKRDISVLKSRETGATWMYIALADWDVRFHPQTHIGMSSKDEVSVDDPENPDSLFSKLQFITHRLPMWMKGIEGVDWKHRAKGHTITNLRNQSTIAGFAATGNIGRGGRKKWWFMDELHAFPPGADDSAMESSQHVCRSRVFVSTPNRKRGQSGAFYEIICEEDKDLERIDIDWKDDEEKARGLYTTDDAGKLVKLDPHYKYPNNYKFILDGKIRSPYFDFEWRRPKASEQSIAAELEKDFGGATARLFSTEVLQEAEKNAEKPKIVGNLKFDSDTLEPQWVQHDNGTTEIWFVPIAKKEFDRSGRRVEKLLPPPGLYSIGIDPARGTGTSQAAYATIIVINKATGEQVAEFRSHKIKPNQLGRLCVAFGKWFYNAYLVPEANAGGGGTEVVAEIKKANYPNLYYRPAGGDEFEKRTKKAGVQNQDKGEKILNSLNDAMARKEVTVRSMRIIKECGQYFYKNGVLVHAAEQGTTDDASKGKGHADSAMGCALAWLGVQDSPPPAIEAEPEDMPDDCFAARRRNRLHEQEEYQPAYWRDYGYAG